MYKFGQTWDVQVRCETLLNIRKAARRKDRGEWHETVDKFHAILQTYGAKTHDIAIEIECKSGSHVNSESDRKAKMHSAKVVYIANVMDSKCWKCCA